MKVSTNKIYAGIHWRSRQKYADYFHALVMKDISKIQPITEKVNLFFIFEWKGRMLDSSNCSFMAKMLEDAMRKWWILQDDNPKYVWKFSCESIKGKENKVKIIISSYE